jgi:hypothetical protein
VRRVIVRPMEARDVDAVFHVSVAAFADLNRRLGDPEDSPPGIAGARIRIGRLRGTDPGGAWVAEAGGEVAGADLLRAYVAAARRDVIVEFITSAQQWAVAPCIEAGLELQPGGAVFLGGDVGPFAPYLPSGAYL